MCSRELKELSKWTASVFPTANVRETYTQPRGTITHKNGVTLMFACLEFFNPVQECRNAVPWHCLLLIGQPLRCCSAPLSVKPNTGFTVLHEWFDDIRPETQNSFSKFYEICRKDFLDRA